MKKKTDPKEEKRFSSRIEENLPDDLYTVASTTMMDALIFGIFDNFENMLADDVGAVMYQYKTFHGKADVHAYWWDWRKRFVLTKEVTNFEVVLSRYYSHACVKVESNQVIMFQIKDGKIAMIASVPLNLSSKYADDNMLNYPLSYESIKRFLSPLENRVDEEGRPVQVTDRVPCLHCGVGSHDLNWYQSLMPNGLFKWHYGQVAVCPICGRVVEYKEVDRSNMDTSDYDYDQLEPNYPYNPNAFSEVGNKLYNKEMIRTLDNTDCEPFMSYLVSQLSQLKDVEPEQGYSLGIRLFGMDNDSVTSHLVIKDAYGNESTDLLEHLVVKPTEMAAWVVYLLDNYSSMLPTIDHGYYNERAYFFSESAIDISMIPLIFHDFSELRDQQLLLPSVTIVKQDDISCVVEVCCCYWHYWKGLVGDKVTYSIYNGKVMKKEEEPMALFYYDCGIFM